MEKYKNKEWLYNEYVVKKRSKGSISRECGVTVTTITTWADKFGITRETTPIYFNEEWLRNEYVNLGKIKSQIAKECGVTITTITKQLEKYGIEKENPLYMNKEYLFQEYIVKDKTKAQIARELGVTINPVTKWIERFGIEKEEKELVPKDWLENEFVVKGKTIAEITEEIGVCRQTITRKIKEYNLIKPEKENPLDDKDWLTNEYINNDRTLESIGDQFGVSKSGVMFYVTKYNLRKPVERLEVDTDCAFCNNTFKMPRHKYNSYKKNEMRTFCSKECFSRALSEERTGEGNWNFGNHVWNGPENASLLAAIKLAELGRHGNTSIEIKIRKQLDLLGLRYEEQKPMYHWLVDFYLPDYKLIIEANGDYWHGNLEKFDKLNSMQRKNKGRDKAKEKYLRKCGYNFLTLWETDINKRIDWCVNQIKEAIRTVG